MSRKKNAPKREFQNDAKYGSRVISKLINTVMYDGNKTQAEKIVYTALEKIKSKTNTDPLEVFNKAIHNVKPSVEVRSRRVGGATYQVPVEVKSSRSQALALRWIISASKKRKNKTMAEKLFYELMEASQLKGSAIKKKEDTHKMAESNKAFAHFRW